MGSIDIGQFLTILAERGAISVTQMMALLGLFTTASQNTEYRKYKRYLLSEMLSRSSG